MGAAPRQYSPDSPLRSISDARSTDSLVYFSRIYMPTRCRTRDASNSPRTHDAQWRIAITTTGTPFYVSMRLLHEREPSFITNAAATTHKCIMPLQPRTIPFSFAFSNTFQPSNNCEWNESSVNIFA